MSFDKERLYKLLPSLYRIRDQEAGGPLQELLSLVAEQIAVLEENFEQLYDDQFIETCAEWVVPYIGDLVGARGLIVFPDAPFTQRAQVANTIQYRRRKGTAAVIEQLVHDVTGWDSNVVEYFTLLATTQYLNHLRPDNLSITGLNDWKQLEYLGTPFDKTARTVDVRNIGRRRGRYNIPNIGIWLWRLASYQMKQSPAFRVDDRRYKFDALGRDLPLYNRSESEDEITHLAQPENVPMPVSRRLMADDPEKYYGINRSVLIYLNGAPVLFSNNMSICNLSDLLDPGGNVIGWANMPTQKIAIDPVLGRIAFPSLLPPPASVRVDYYYGFSAEMGGGTYGRTATFATDLEQEGLIKVPSERGTIQEAITALSATGGVIEIEDSAYYIETPVISLPAGSKIEIRGAEEVRPVLVLSANLEIIGGPNTEVSFNGLLIAGGCLHVPWQNGSGDDNELSSLQIRHCTLVPGPTEAIGSVPAQPFQPRVVVEAAGTTLDISQSIVGGIRAAEGAIVHITDSIIDAAHEQEVAFAGLDDRSPGGVMQVKNTTIIGKVNTRIMELASNTIFYASLQSPDTWISPVSAERLQEGCVRFSYLPPGHSLPRPYQCQPAPGADPARVRPVFTSLLYGDAGYCQLSGHCATEIKEGADDEAEMGAFHNLYQPQRESNLRVRLNEYLRFGLEAGIFYGS
jgi:hypothetical protein